MKKKQHDWKPLLDSLQTRLDRANAQGGEEKIRKHQARGKMTARERIESLLDKGSFNEIGALAGGQPPDGSNALAGDGVVGGTGFINGIAAAVLAEDATVKGGSIGHANMAKRSRLITMATEKKLPLIIALDGAGHRVEAQSARYPYAPNDLQLIADLAGQVPILTMILGYSAGHGALTGMFSDFTVMSQNAAVFTAGPPLVEAALGSAVTPTQLGGPDVHTMKSGVIHNVAEDDGEAIAQIKSVLQHLASQESQPLESTSGEGLMSPTGTLPEEIIPPRADAPYDIVHLINALCDIDSFFELQPAYGNSIVTGLASFAGHSVMVVANQPCVLAGAITADAAKKAAHFIEVADNRNLPLLFLLDNPGVMPGIASEKEGILKASATMFAAQRRYHGKKIVVTLRKAYGFGSSVMGMNPWDGQAISLALPGVHLGGVPALGGSRAANLDSEREAELISNESGAWVPADAMAFDKVIPPNDIRQEIINAL